jgi:C-terminal processing protease CtpA/Prc
LNGNRKPAKEVSLFNTLLESTTVGFSNQRAINIAIIKIERSPSLCTRIQQIASSMLDGAAGIILDLRGNGGGDAEAMADVVSPFLEDGSGLGKFVDRSGASFELHSYSKKLWPSPSAIALPIAVLTNESTSSAAEIMASALQTKRGARVIGSVSCGCVLAIRSRHTLPDGGVPTLASLIIEP